MSEIEAFESFENEIRRYEDEESGETFFVVVDVVEVLTESSKPGKYWTDMKRRADGKELAAICRKFPIVHKSNGRTYQTDCADIKGMLRIVQSIPSAKAEPFKQWLAEVGQDRIEETADPSLALDRAYELYLQRGYSRKWIALRLKHTDVRNALVSEWNNRAVSDEQFNELLDIISRETFEMDIAEYKSHKGLDGENLQDHMTDAEMVISMLGEVSTAHFVSASDAQGYEENADMAQKGGKIAKSTRENLEQQSGRDVISKVNYLEEPEQEVRKKLNAPKGNGEN